MTDPELLVRFTPYLHRIDVDGERWIWHMAQIPALGSTFALSFTELMTFEDLRRIGFTHDPSRTEERAAVEGEYRLHPTDRGSHVEIDLAITCDLPLPRVLRPAGNAAMNAIVNGMGRVFAQNMTKYLGE